MGRDSDAARAVAEAFDRHALPRQQARRAVLLFLDNTLFCHDRDPYRLLGLTPGCDLADIRRRHKRLLQVFHPDRHPDEQDSFTDRSERLNRAYAYLKANHGKPGATTIPNAATVTPASSPRPAAARPSRATRHKPAPVVPDKNELRRRLKTWVGNPANLQQRVYIAVIAIPVLLLGLLYLTDPGRSNQAAPILAKDTNGAGATVPEQDETRQPKTGAVTATAPERQPATTAPEPDAATETGEPEQPSDTHASITETVHPDDRHPTYLAGNPYLDLPYEPESTTSAEAAPESEPTTPERPTTNNNSEPDATSHENQATRDVDTEHPPTVTAKTQSGNEPQPPNTKPQTPDQSRAPSPITEIKHLLETYQTAYNVSDIDTFTDLFRDNARTKNAANKQEIRQKYGDLFRETRARHLVVDDISIKILDERQFQVKSRYSVDWTYPNGKTNSSAGRFNIHLVTVNGELKIWRLDY